MTDLNVFPAETAVKLTASPRPSIIAGMSTRVACAGLVAAALACNGGLQPTPASPGISGSVTFRGAVPDSTQAVYVVAYHTFPHSRDSLFTFQPPVQSLDTLPLGGAAAPYHLSAASGP